MKHSFFILLLTLPCLYSLACGPFDRLYLPEQYYTFRICGYNMNGLKSPQQDLKQILGENNFKRHTYFRHKSGCL